MAGPAAILDVDGTLVDSNYHHALAWHRAFRSYGLVVPVCRLHRHVGMGGDKFVAAVAGPETEKRLGDAVRARWEKLFDELLVEVEPFAGARELIVELKQRGHQVVLASSAIEKHLNVFLDKLEARQLVDGWTSKEDVEHSKPAPDLLTAAMELLGTSDALLVGDTPWDVAAARDAGIKTIGVLTGGFSHAELYEAGSIAVYDSADQLRQDLDESAFTGDLEA
jgi:HAD superfamily hydrolase (TIGR01509 family)